MQALKTLISSLKKKKQTIAVAESITGGYVSYLLSSLPGSSKVFRLGLVPYGGGAKKKLFNLSASYLKKTQGVSQELAHQLAKKVRTLSDADVGAAIVGFAGPQAPHTMKGTVYMAVARRKAVHTRCKKFKGSRDRIRKDAALALVRFILDTIT
jgi:nicotinamide-nucleotide amidase